MNPAAPKLRQSPDWMPITPKTGSLFHAGSQEAHTCLLIVEIDQCNDT